VRTSGSAVGAELTASILSTVAVATVGVFAITATTTTKRFVNSTTVNAIAGRKGKYLSSIS
jgi:hypothetical protein